jgi:hypothetical protein
MSISRLRRRSKYVVVNAISPSSITPVGLNIRPSFQGQVNVTDKCDCGNRKNVLRQWCDTCWDKVPLKVARNYQTRCLALARQIVTCKRFIKDYDIGIINQRQMSL